jgi:hypothetical protein
LWHIEILKINKNKETQLSINSKNLIDLIHTKQEQMEKEKEIKQEICRINTDLESEFKRKKSILSLHYRQEYKLKVKIYITE